MDNGATALARGKQRGIRRLRIERAMQRYAIARRARRQCEVRMRRYCADGQCRQERMEAQGEMWKRRTHNAVGT